MASEQASQPTHRTVGAPCEPTDRHELAADVSFVVESPVLFAPDAAEVARRTAARARGPVGRAGRVEHVAHDPDAFPSPPLLPLESCVSAPVDDELCSGLARAAEIEAGAGLDRFLRSLESMVSESQSGRLGLLFEVHVRAWLEAAHGSDAVVTHIPVRTSTAPADMLLGHPKGTRTWGEFDVAFRTASEAVEHWELAVKFYLKIGRGGEWPTCVGPGLRDRLDVKGTRTFLRQLPLSATREGLDALTRAFNQPGARTAMRIEPASVVRRAFTKGTIFYPHVGDRSPQDAWTAGAVVEGLSPSHSKGWWVRPDDGALGALEEAWPRALACPLHRLRWMGGLAPSRALRIGEHWHLFRSRLPERLARAGERNECLLVSVHDPGDGSELSRGFVVTRRFLEGAGLA